MAKLLKSAPAAQIAAEASERSWTQQGASQSQPAIEVDHLFKRYPGNPTNVVEDISFTVERGEILGLLGPNGAGKTTTIGILTTRIQPTGGNVRVMGVDVVADPMRVKQCISVVPQMNNLDQSLRAREVLTFHGSYYGMPRAERERRADVLLDELGLATRGKDKVSNYSGGMAQRLLLGRALMHTPDVLFLDEPTSSLDPQSRLFLWERIQDLNKHGLTVLLTTHDMDEADRLCGRIAIMDKGKILVIDTATELKKRFTNGSRLELHIWRPDGVTLQRIQTALTLLPGVTAAEEVPFEEEEERPADISYLYLYAANAATLVAAVSHTIATTGAEVRHIHLSHSSLEDVFISLTGRNLRS